MSDSIGQFALTPLRSIEIGGLFGDRSARVDTAEGPVTLLFGQNGAGKSTILRVVSQLLGPGIANLPLEPITSATLSFDGGGQVLFQAGPPAEWEEVLPDGTRNKERLPETNGSDLDPAFSRFVAHETPYYWQDGRVLTAGGTPLPPSVLNQLRASFKRSSLRRGLDPKVTVLERRRLARECFLISSDRLVSSEYRVNFDPRTVHESKLSPNRRLLGLEQDVVEGIAVELREVIREARRKSFIRSSNLDGSFITRAAVTLKGTEPLGIEQRAALVNEILNLQRRLVASGLATSNYEIPKFDDGSRDIQIILDLYLKDLLDKAEENREQLQKLELFEEILDSHFTDKSVSLDAEVGFAIKRRSGGMTIPLDRLSSGERHLIVLFHHLIFRTKPGGLCLIDEPEISLHVDWQERFIDSVAKVASVSPQQYLIATHAPSIVGRHYDLMRDIRGDSVES